MKMQKKILFVLMIFLMIASNVSAKSFYTNKNGAIFTLDEYDFISKMYYDGYQDLMSIDDLKMLRNNDVIGDNIVSVFSAINEPQIANSLNTGGRILSMNKSCGASCLVTISATWTGTPTIKSYDVLGFRTSGVSISSSNSAVVTGTNYNYSYSSNKSANNGRGYSIKFPNTTNVSVYASIYTSKGGTVYGSYQHAKSNISLNNSKLYTFNSNGSWGTFLFYGAAFGKYDNVDGLSLSV